jgi:hypothetical protein
MKFRIKNAVERGSYISLGLTQNLVLKGIIVPSKDIKTLFNFNKVEDLKGLVAEIERSASGYVVTKLIGKNLISKYCVFSNKDEEMELPVTQSEVDAWFNLPNKTRPFVQKQFPYLNAGEREFLLTGITPEHWNKMMGAEDE